MHIGTGLKSVCTKGFNCKELMDPNKGRGAGHEISGTGPYGELVPVLAHLGHQLPNQKPAFKFKFKLG